MPVIPSPYTVIQFYMPQDFLLQSPLTFPSGTIDSGDIC